MRRFDALWGMHDFTRLAIWQRSAALSVTMCGVIARTKVRRHRALLNQLDRSIMSIPTNIAEGAGQPTDRQFASFLGHALGSINESVSHLALAEGLLMFRREDLEAWQGELLQLRRMTIGFQRRLLRHETRAATQLGPAGLNSAGPALESSA